MDDLRLEPVAASMELDQFRDLQFVFHDEQEILRHVFALGKRAGCDPLWVGPTRGDPMPAS